LGEILLSILYLENFDLANMRQSVARKRSHPQAKDTQTRAHVKPHFFQQAHDGLQPTFAGSVSMTIPALNYFEPSSMLTRLAFLNDEALVSDETARLFVAAKLCVIYSASCFHMRVP